jgi:hypothetical protein
MVFEQPLCAGRLEPALDSDVHLLPRARPDCACPPPKACYDLRKTQYPIRRILRLLCEHESQPTLSANPAGVKNHDFLAECIKEWRQIGCGLQIQVHIQKIATPFVQNESLSVQVSLPVWPGRRLWLGRGGS